MRMLPLACIAVFSLSACSTVDLPKEVRVEVPVKCVKSEDIPERPPLRSDDEFMALDDYRFVIALWDERREREVYERKQAAILIACKE